MVAQRDLMLLEASCTGRVRRNFACAYAHPCSRAWLQSQLSSAERTLDDWIKDRVRGESAALDRVQAAVRVRVRSRAPIRPH